MASDLGLHCLPVSHKKDASLLWVKKLDAHTTPKNNVQSVQVFCASIASFGLFKGLMVSKFYNVIHDAKGQEN